MEDWRPTASFDVLRRRGEMQGAIRSFFQQKNFLEIETPILSRDCVVERHLTPWVAAVHGQPTKQPVFLQNSPEFAMKRLIAAGAGSIFQFAKSFRADEQGPLHNPEFTMLEWYELGADYVQAIATTAKLCALVLPDQTPTMISYRDAFLTEAQIDPWNCTNETLRLAASRANINIPEGSEAWDRDQWLNLLLAFLIEPRLGVTAPTFLVDYPPSQGALANLAYRHDQTLGDYQVAERFELYVRGVELANGYHELQDAQELAARNRDVNWKRSLDGLPPLPEQSRLIAAMDNGLPPCAGVALGFDRLVMLALNLKSIHDVIAFPFERA